MFPTSVTSNSDTVKQDNLKAPVALRGEKNCKCVIQHLKQKKNFTDLTVYSMGARVDSMQSNVFLGQVFGHPRGLEATRLDLLELEINQILHKLEFAFFF